MRGVIYLISFILLAPLASAQEILIGGKIYPLVIVAPLLLIVLVWAIILLIYLKRNFHKISLVIFNLKNWLKRAGLGKIADMISNIKIPKKKEESEAPKKEEEELPKKDLSPHLETLNSFEKKLPRLKMEEAFKRFIDLSRDFFGDLLGMHYEFTDEELVHELHKKKRNLVKFAKELAEIKYSGETIGKEKLLEILQAYRSIVENYAKKTRGIGVDQGKLVSSLIEKDKQIFENIKSYVNFLKTENRKNQIEDLLNEERTVLKKHIKDVKKTYKKILKYYVQLKPNDRAKIYPQLMQFYKEINDAIFSSVYGDRSKKELQELKEDLEQIKHLPRKVPFIIRLKKNIKALMPERKAKEKKQETPMQELKKEAPHTEFYWDKASKSEAQDIQEQKPKKVKGKPIQKYKKDELKIINKFKNIFQTDIEVKEELKGMAKKRKEIKKEKEELKKELKTTKSLGALKKESTVGDAQIHKKLEEPPKPLAQKVKRPKHEDQKAKEAKERKLKALAEKKQKQEEARLKKKQEREEKKALKEKLRMDKKELRFDKQMARVWELINNGKLKKAKERYQKLKPMFHELSEKRQGLIYSNLFNIEKYLEKEIKKANIDKLEKEKDELIKKIESI